MRTCTSCGASLDETAAFCSVCGTTAPARVPAATAASTTVPAAAAPAAAPAGASQAVATAPPVSAPVAAPPGAVPTLPAPAQAPAAPARSGRTKLIVGAAGGVVALAALGFLVLGGPDPAPAVPVGPGPDVGPTAPAPPIDPGPTAAPQPTAGPTTAPDPTPTPQPTVPTPDPTPTPTPEPEPPPSGGGLQDLVLAQVGPFTIEEAAPLPGLVSAGALEAYELMYRHSDGTPLQHLLVAMPDAADAADVAQGFARRNLEEWADEGWVLEGQQELAAEDGTVYGQWYLLRTPDGLTKVIWSNGQLVAQAFSGGDLPIEFYQNVPY